MKKLYIYSTLLSLVCFACDKKEAPKPEAAKPVTSESSTEKKHEAKVEPSTSIVKASPSAMPAPAMNTPAAKEPVITLISAGAEPKAPLRLHVKKGQTDSCTMAMKMGMAMDMGGGKKMPETKLPTITMPMVLTVTDAVPNGNISYDFKFDKIQLGEEPGVQPEVLKALRESMASINGLSGHAVSTDRGLSKSMELNIPTTLPPQVRQVLESMKTSMTQMSSPLPEEPVGVGAQWKVANALNQGGMTVQQEAVYELKEKKGDALKLHVTITQKADHQIMAMPGMPPTAKAELVALHSNGDGNVELSLSKLAPVQGTMKLTAVMEMNVTESGKAQPLNMKTTVEVKMQGK